MWSDNRIFASYFPHLKLFLELPEDVGFSEEAQTNTTLGCYGGRYSRYGQQEQGTASVAQHIPSLSTPQSVGDDIVQSHDLVKQDEV